MAEGLNDEGGKVLSVYLPPELVAIGAGPDLQRFFDAMVYKLRRNAHKGKWEDLPLETAFGHLRGELEELHSACGNGSSAEVLMEAADVANEALIVSSIMLEARGAR